MFTSHKYNSEYRVSYLHVPLNQEVEINVLVVFFMFVLLYIVCFWSGVVVKTGLVTMMLLI